MNSLNILHLSDLHIGNFKYDNPATLSIKIANTLNDAGRKVDVVVVSGDIYDGKSDTSSKDLKTAILFFETLIKQLNGKEISSKELTNQDVIFVPGNHDLVRTDPNQYKKFDEFIREFYKGTVSPNLIVVDDYNFIYENPEKKVVILGFNSCKIELEEIKEKELEWINKIDLVGFDKQSTKIKEKIKSYLENHRKWDDFGYIDPVEMDNVFTMLKKMVPAYGDYNIVATFHHHFYPFPEIVGNRPDASFIRNYTTVLDQFQRFKIRLVLHGHKHLSIQIAITDNKYFEDPESIIYVLSA